MPYTQVTENQFIAELSASLGDSGNVFWNADECRRALHESLLLWGALTSYWTTTGTFPVAAGTRFYELATQLPLLRRRDYTFGDLTTEIQYHLLEPQAAGVAGTGMTSQFTVGQITAALKRRRNQFVIDTHLPLTNLSSAVSASAQTFALPESWAAIDRMTYQETASGVFTPMRRVDLYGSQAYIPQWQATPAKPYGYAQAENEPLTLFLVPPPLNAGTFHFLIAQTLDLAIADGTSFAIPDEFAWALKWGALYDLLSSNNPGFDPTRAKYCLERYNMALTTAEMARSMLRVRLDGSNLPLATMAELDDGKPFWLTGRGAVTTAATAYDVLSFYRIPAQNYTASLDVVQAAPLPASGTDFVQVGREELNYLYDYCRHILSWKCGGAEFIQTLPLHDNFLAGAAKRNKALETRARYLTSLFQRGDLKDQLVA